MEENNHHGLIFQHNQIDGGDSEGNDNLPVLINVCQSFDTSENHVNYGIGAQEYEGNCNYELTDNVGTLLLRRQFIEYYSRSMHQVDLFDQPQRPQRRTMFSV